MSRLIGAALLAAGVFMTSPDPTLAQPAGSQDTARVLALKQRIGFDAALAAERLDEHVELAWETFPVPPALQSWALERDFNRLPQAESRLQMRLKQGTARVTIRLHIYPADERARVAERLIQRADAVTTVDLSDTRGPPELGTLSLQPAASSSQVVYWIYRNVYAEVTCYQTPVDAIDIARWIQARLEQHARPN